MLLEWNKQVPGGGSGGLLSGEAKEEAKATADSGSADEDSPEGRDAVSHEVGTYRVIMMVVVVVIHC